MFTASTRRWYSIIRASSSAYQSFSSHGSSSSSRLGGILWSIPIVTLGLGTWQVYRLDWKLDLIQKAKDRIHQAPIELTEILDGLDRSFAETQKVSPTKDLQFTRVKAKGTFLHDKEMLVGPRTRSDQEQGGAGGLFGSGNPVGYFVFTPFKLEESGEVILVNRGWIPRNARDQRSRREGQIPGLVEIEGILREGESSSALTIPNNPQKNEWYTISTSEMAQVTGASTTLVELVADSLVNQSNASQGSPILRNPRINLANNHVQYAMVWYGLCAFSVIALLKGRGKKTSKWPPV